jgi:hypothetical protein
LKINVTPTQVLSVVVVVLVLVISYLTIHIKDVNNTNKRYKQNITALTDEVKTYSTKNGLLISEKKSLLSSMKELKELDRELYDSINKLNKTLKLKTTNIETVVIKGKDKVVYDTVLVKEDPNGKGVITLPYKDSTIEFTTKIPYSYKDSLIVNKDSINTEFDIQLGVTTVSGWKKEKWNKSPELVTSVHTTDKRFTVTSINSWTDQTFANRVIMRPGVMPIGVIWDPINNNVSVGIGIGFVLTTIEKQK